MATGHESRAEWREHALEELRRAGHRSGGARSAVVDLMARQHCCLTAQDIFDRLREDGTVVGIASVYRALDLLSRMNLVRRMDLAEAAYFEPAHPAASTTTTSCAIAAARSPSSRTRHWRPRSSGSPAASSTRSRSTT